MENQLGIPLSVIRSARGDFTLGGVSSTHSQLTLVGFSVSANHDLLTPIPAQLCNSAYLDEAPPVGLMVRFRGADTFLDFTPAEYDAEQGVWRFTRERTMAGGNYAHSHDDRFQRLIYRCTGASFFGAISIHDRVESD
ncbi:hypothetical protein ACFQ9V_08800 [Leifsonia sp. NPDC056665]|uniref:hypothetical protein n=1 Tax=Leifsonia sp. NPDC056665 TaxID=3345901 RepID=UPI0036BB3625